MRPSFARNALAALAMTCVLSTSAFAEDPPAAPETEAPAWATAIEATLDPDNFDAPGKRLDAAEKTLRAAIEKGAGVGANLALAEILLANDKNDDARALFAPALTNDDASFVTRARTMEYMVDSGALRSQINALRGKENADKQKPLTVKLKAVHESYLAAMGGEANARAAFGGLRGTMKQLQSLKALGAPISNIDKPDLEGKTIALDSYKGKVVLLDFWAVWCGPCVREMPNVIAAYGELHDKGFEIIGISLDKDEKRLQDYIAKNEMTWRQYFDGKGWKNEVATEWGVRSIPATYLIDHEGVVRYVGLRGEALKAKVELLLEHAEKAKAEKASAG